MANIASTKRRVRKNAQARARNRARKSNIKSETRKLNDAIHRGDLQAAKEQFVIVTKTVDQVAAKGTWHRNTAARFKSRLARKLNAAVAASSS